MKKNLLLLLLSVLVFSSFAQHIDFKVASKKIADKTYIIEATAKLPNHWYLYHNNPTIDGLSNIKFVYFSDNVQPIDSLVFSKKEENVADEIFETKTNVHKNEVIFHQTITLKSIVPASIKVDIAGFKGNFVTKDFLDLTDSIEYEVVLEGGVKQATTSLILPNVDIDNPTAKCGDKVEKGNLFSIFFLGFVGGLIALLTPCMFPMIPVTVSFFTKRSPTRKKGIQNGLMYGFFIFLIYTLASLPFHLIDGISSDIFNIIATNSIVNIVFFAVFIVFAISFFGYFEITLPHQFAGKADSKSNVGSVFGIFFMALTLVIVSFSCTGIILGTLLVGTAQSGAMALTIGMAGFGLALGLPFALFAIFPNWLESLPKSGGWLDVVKKVLAFVEVALALKFLSNADLVMQWGILHREVFIACWIIISILLSLYAFGVIRLPHDYKGQKITVGRKIIGFTAIAFALYLIPGLTKTKYANLKLLSGIAPPLSYSIYKDEHRYKGLEANVVNDFDKAVALAKAQNKPLLIDFTGWNCANCRQMEENIWTLPEIEKAITENFVLVSLYVDDGTKLPIEKQIINYSTKDGSKRDVTTIGNKYSILEYDNFKASSQPLYVILNNEGKLLTYPVGKSSAEDYLAWLQCGIEAFKK
jgi:thiol:disulfide interchange protein